MSGTVGERKSRLFNRQTISWAMYDFANSSYILIIPAVSFAVYYRTVVCAGDDRADVRWAILISCSLGAAGILSPLIGAIADIAKLRRLLFIFMTTICCLASAMLFQVHAGDVLLGAIIFFCAHTTYGVAISLYDSYLRELVKDEALLGRLSGAAWGFGYLGGIACLAICFPLLRGGFADENLLLYRSAFVVTAGFYLVFSLPAFFFLPRQGGESTGRSRMFLIVRDAYVDLWRTVRSWRSHREAFKFLLSFYFISDAIVTVIYFTAIYLQVNFDMTIVQILGLTVVIQAIGIPATAAFGYLGDRWGKRRTIFATLAIWVGVVLLMVFGSASYVPYVMAGLMSLVLGSTQALCRSLYSEMIPKDRSAEFFGFSTFAGKVSSVLGPIVFGLVASASGSQRLGLASLLVFFAVGASILASVRTPGQAQDALKDEGRKAQA